MIRYFDESIYTDKINTDKAEMDESSLLKSLVGFNNKSRPRTIEGKVKKRYLWKCTYALYEGRELIFNASKSGIFPIKSIKVKDFWTKSSKITNSSCISKST